MKLFNGILSFVKGLFGYISNKKKIDDSILILKMPFTIKINNVDAFIYNASIKYDDNIFYYVAVNKKIIGCYHADGSDNEYSLKISKRLKMELQNKLDQGGDYFKNRISFEHSHFFERISIKNKFIEMN